MGVCVRDVIYSLGWERMFDIILHGSASSGRTAVAGVRVAIQAIAEGERGCRLAQFAPPRDHPADGAASIISWSRLSPRPWGGWRIRWGADGKLEAEPP